MPKRAKRVAAPESRDPREIGPFYVLNAILCEDVRLEPTGKHMLIGVFSGNIVVAKMPAKIAIAFYIEAQVLELGEHILYIRMRSPGGSEVKMEARMTNTERGKSIALGVPRGELQIPEEGEIEVCVSHNEKDWISIIRKLVTVGAVKNPLVLDESE